MENWEQIRFAYRVVPGYADEQKRRSLQPSAALTIGKDGKLNSDLPSTWTYNAPWLQFNWSNGSTDKVFVQKGRDWQNQKSSIIFTRLDNAGGTIWGKKK